VTYGGQQLYVGQVTESGVTSMPGGIGMLAAAKLLLFVKACDVLA
jgi:hypothetical protein